METRSGCLNEWVDTYFRSVEVKSNYGMVNTVGDFKGKCFQGGKKGLVC